MTFDGNAFAPTDGSAAELNDNPACLVQGCPEPPITHRSMRVSVPVHGVGPDGENTIVDRVEQTIQAALCASHARLLDQPLSTGKVTQIADYRREIEIAETTGKID